jgi:solute carrier family 8 (sodium/calcium exchanger)
MIFIINLFINLLLLSLKISLVNNQDGIIIDKKSSVCVITIIDNDRVAGFVNAELETFEGLKNSWGNQFKQAMNVKNGDIESAGFKDYILHFFALPWKIAFAFVPPAYLLGGWLSFFISLIIIGIMTAIVGDAAAIFGCLVGLKDSVTAIT